jgi:hypothetical protein
VLADNILVSLLLGPISSGVDERVMHRWAIYYLDWAEMFLVCGRSAGASACLACAPGTYANWTGVENTLTYGKE